MNRQTDDHSDRTIATYDRIAGDYHVVPTPGTPRLT
jgi:hypothetical protein